MFIDIQRFTHAFTSQKKREHFILDIAYKVEVIIKIKLIFTCKIHAEECDDALNSNRI